MTKKILTTILLLFVLLVNPNTALSLNLSDSVYVRKNDTQREIPSVSLMTPTITLPASRLNRFNRANVEENDTQAEIIRIRTFEPFRQWKLTGGYRANMYNEKRTNHILELGITKVNDAGNGFFGFTY